jgi:hypothetical protein
MAYPTTPLKSFADVQNLLNAFLKSAGFPIGGAPHQTFWQTNVLTGDPMTYEEFTTGKLPLPPPYDSNYQYPVILNVGDAASSPIINMLNGSGPYWDAVGNIAGQMPQDNPPYNAADPPQTLVIQLLTDWINAKCPNEVSDSATEDT